MTDSEVKAALNDFQVLSLSIFGEARGEYIEGKVAVGCVIRNRVRTPGRWGDTYRAVCLARAQFSCWFAAGGQANYDRVIGLARHLVADHAIRTTLAPDPVLDECRYVADGIMGGRLLDRVKGANHYLTTDLLRTAPPAWTEGRTPVCTVLGHSFFRL